ncbi:MAG: metallophosphoesterase [Chloroflexi bacterium]|nr:metallophosphoesterase [Chloroflexota bacterium]MBP7045862.1 metallophosphoesterase [Chloroflexota bacterium]
MLVVISDLHFVDATSGDHNLPAKAFEQIFLSNIISLAKKNKATEIKLLLLGDIPDLIRSEQWFDEEPENRPWGANGLRDIPTPRLGSRVERRCLDILGRFPESGKQTDVPENTILFQNWDTFTFFRNFHKIIHEELGREIPVRIIYIVGNHDRLINLYPSLRDELRKMLGLTVNNQTVQVLDGMEWWYPYTFVDEAYGVFARHGHQYDVYNYNGTTAYTRADHLQVPVGDIIATEFAVNLPRTLRLLQAEYPVVTDDLVKAMQDIDNVRPLGRMMEWFFSKMRELNNPDILEALDKTLDTVVNHLFDVEFVQNWHNPKTHVDEVLRTLSRTPFKNIIETLTRITDANRLLPLLLPTIERTLNEGGLDDYTIGAFYEPEYREPESETRYILYGHTHTPVLRPLDAVNGRDIIYLNTGTWRGRFYRTISLDKTADFIGMKQLTYLVFYNVEEDKKDKELGTIGFESWTGNQKKAYLKDMDKQAAFLAAKAADPND